MKRTLWKVAAFFAVFFISAVLIGTFMNMGNQEMAVEMPAASLPEMCMVFKGRQINPMRGYVTPMEVGLMRESITSVDESRWVDAMVFPWGQQIGEISYEVRDASGDRLIENARLTDWSEQDGSIPLHFHLQDLIEEGEEYSLTFALTLGDGRQVRYYTRIVQRDDSLEEKLAFAESFHQATFDADTLEPYSIYLEPDSRRDNSTLSCVDIHSSFRQVAWGGLPVRQEGDARMTVRELSPQTASITLAYLVSYPMNRSRVQARVEEYYRVRYTPQRMYLLDFERNLEQRFDEGGTLLDQGKLVLGIVDSGLSAMESSDGNAIAFVNDGAVYCYSGASGKLARLYAFDRGEGADGRTQGGCDYRVLRVEESGDVVFLAVGYQSRGSHEGECGVSVIYYNSSLNTTEELAYLPCFAAPEILQADVEKLSYLNGEDELYLMIDGSIYRIALEGGSCEPVAKNVRDDSYRVSEDGSSLAWQLENQRFASGALAVKNFGTGSERRIEAGGGRYILPLGYMGNDLIYGLAWQADVTRGTDGGLLFPMYRLVILGENGETLLEYEQEGYYVTDAEVAGNQITLKRLRRGQEGFTDAADDQILYNAAPEPMENTVETAVTKNLGAIVQVAVKSAPEGGKVQFLLPKQALFEGSRTLPIQAGTQADREAAAGTDVGRYYVYGKFGVTDILTDPVSAVERAYEEAGAIMLSDGSYVWKRDRLHNANQIMAITAQQEDENRNSLAVCLDSIFSLNGLTRDSGGLLRGGSGAFEILQENLEGRYVLDLQGISLDMALYYPDREIPVLALLRNGGAVLITGYNEQEVVFLDPEAGTLSKRSLGEAREFFAQNGNHFISYR